MFSSYQMDGPQMFSSIGEDAFSLFYTKVECDTVLLFDVVVCVLGLITNVFTCFS